MLANFLIEFFYSEKGTVFLRHTNALLNLVFESIKCSRVFYSIFVVQKGNRNLASYQCNTIFFKKKHKMPADFLFDFVDSEREPQPCVVST